MGVLSLYALIYSILLKVWGAVIIMVYMDLMHLLSIYGFEVGFRGGRAWYGNIYYTKDARS